MSMNRIRILGITVLGLLGLALIGCSSVENNLVGKWSQKLPDLTSRKVIPGKGKPATTITPSAPKITHATLELKADKTYSMMLDVPSSGEWSYDGIVLVLKTKTVDGKTPAEYASHPTGQPRNYKDPLGLGMTEDQKTLTLSAPGGNNGYTGVDPVAFEKGS